MSTDERTDGRKDGRMDGQTNPLLLSPSNIVRGQKYTFVSVILKNIGNITDALTDCLK